MSERNEKRIINVIFAVLAVIIIVFAVDIEIKLTKLMKSDAVVVNTNPEVSEATTVDVYSFHNELTADNTTSTQPLYSAVYTSDTVTVITSSTTQPFTQASTTQITTELTAPSETVPAVTEAPTTDVPSTIWSVDADQNFYRTKSGTKYHKADCPYLKSSRILVTVDEIVSEGYEPCSKCMKGE